MYPIKIPPQRMKSAAEYGPVSKRVLPKNVAVLGISHLEEDLTSLRWIFKHSKWDLYEARNCHEAVACLHEDVIPVVITDRNVPGGGWKRMVHEVGRLAPVPKLIVTYRFSEGFSVNETLTGGAYHVLVKPFSRSEVFQAIGFAWQQWEREQEKANSFQRMTGSF